MIWINNLIMSSKEKILSWQFPGKNEEISNNYLQYQERLVISVICDLIPLSYL